MKTIVIKLGGSILQDFSWFESFGKQLLAAFPANSNVVLVHGGGPFINQRLLQAGLRWRFVDGHRVTTPNMMKIIEEVLWKVVNQQIVTTLKELGMKAIGLPGILNCTQQSQILGLVGQVESIELFPLKHLWPHTIPVVPPLGIGPDKRLYNINADVAACQIAKSVSADSLIFMTDTHGIQDPNGQRIRKISFKDISYLLDSDFIQGGMKIKLRTAQEALGEGVKSVSIVKNLAGATEGDLCTGTYLPGVQSCIN